MVFLLGVIGVFVMVVDVQFFVFLFFWYVQFDGYICYFVVDKCYNVGLDYGDGDIFQLYQQLMVYGDVFCIIDVVQRSCCEDISQDIVDDVVDVVNVEDVVRIIYMQLVFQCSYVLDICQVRGDIDDQCFVDIDIIICWCNVNQIGNCFGVGVQQ